MDRPGLRVLLAEVDAGGIDVVVVYKVDRLTRSLTDFARIVDRFDAQGVSFVSVTQSFNTTSSMGRLTLNVLLSFAQFEREVGAERVRDKIAASRKKGMWMGGAVPMGYRAEGKKLVIDEGEAATVRRIFALYLECGSTPALLVRLRNEGIVTVRRVSRGGRVSGGVAFGTGSISYRLHNPVYIGEVEHKGCVYPGEHRCPSSASGAYTEALGRI
jgi:site-specific DNA recombinase